MADEEANLTDEERAELENPVIEDEDDHQLVDLPDDALDKPSDMPDGDVEDDSGFLEEVVDENDPILTKAEGTRVGVGSFQ
jgi:hypothetical protein